MRIRKSFVVAKTGIIVFSVTFVGILFLGSDISFFSSARTQLASLFFAHDITVAEISKKYHRKQLTVLIVPGHDNIDGGTSYKGVSEADYTAKIGQYLYEYLENDPNIDAVLVRNKNGYTKEFADYFAREGREISVFTNRAVERFNSLKASNQVEKPPPPFMHVRANSRVTKILYGLNKWANDHGVDIVLHIHLNNYPRRSGEIRYEGYSVYIPDSTLPNHAPSKAIAEALSGTFSRFWAKSNLHLEKDTIIEDPDLIALGSYGSLRAASVLLEYGYIYEPRFQNELLLKETAFRTYQGLVSYFGDSRKITDEFAWLFPYEWKKPLSYGVLRSNDVVAFQAALLKLGLYPPNGASLADCPVSGNFKECTRDALSSFQEKYGIVDEHGVLGYKTRQTLNEIF